jgi:hypothetical protein
MREGGIDQEREDDARSIRERGPRAKRRGEM